MKKLMEKSYETVFSFMAIVLYWVSNIGFIEMMDSMFDISMGNGSTIVLLVISGIIMIRMRNYAAMDYYVRHFMTKEGED